MQLSLLPPATQQSVAVAPVGNSSPPITGNGIPPLLNRQLRDYEHFAIELLNGYYAIFRRWTVEDGWLTLSLLRGNGGRHTLTAMTMPVKGILQVRLDQIAVCSIITIDDRG